MTASELRELISIRYEREDLRQENKRLKAQIKFLKQKHDVGLERVPVVELR